MNNIQRGDVKLLHPLWRGNYNSPGTGMTRDEIVSNHIREYRDRARVESER
jgi:hypothetical protein